MLIKGFFFAIILGGHDMKLKKVVTFAMASVLSASFLAGCSGMIKRANKGDEKYNYWQ